MVLFPGFLDKVDPAKITDFEKKFLEHIRATQRPLLDQIAFDLFAGQAAGGIDRARLGHGDAVAVGDVIGLIEVMKSFHEVKAEVAGANIRFEAENEEPVMAGALLAEVE